MEEISTKYESYLDFFIFSTKFVYFKTFFYPQLYV